MPQKNLDGVALSWKDEGVGTPLVLLHAFPLNSSMWDLQRSELAGEFRVITPDFRGFGQSEITSVPSTMERLAEDTHTLVKELGLDDIVLGGLSMGGYVAFAFYRKYARAVRALVLADTRAAADTDDGKQARAELAAVAERMGSPSVAESLLPKLLGESTRRNKPDLVDSVRNSIAGARREAIISALRGMALRRDSFDLLPRIQCPTLVLVGQEDQLTPLGDSQALADAIPRSQLTVISQAGHLSNLEQPENFNTTVRRFLASLK